MKKSFTYIIGGILIIIVIGIGVSSKMKIVDTDTVYVPAENTRVSGETATQASTPVKTVPAKLKVTNFTGKLQTVDTGCFSDGECFIVVDGKHITTLRGWTHEVVGDVKGVDGFGDLQKHIGEYVEVYAKDSGDGTYTLYGSEGFYINLIGKTLPQ